MLAGSIRYVSPPSRWALAGLGVAAVVILGGALRAPSVYRERLLVVLAATTLLAFGIARAGRELYGRPSVPVVNLIWLACTAVICCGGCYLLIRGTHETRVLVGILVAPLGLYQALAYYAMLTNGIALSEIPTPASQACVALGMVCVGPTVVLAFFDEESQPARTARARLSRAPG
jgi:hypothetical protein